MMDKPFLYFLTKIIATIASVIVLSSTNVDITVIVISTLSFACIFVLEILLGRVKKYNKIIMVTISVCMIACFSLGIDMLFPLLMVLAIHLLDLTIDSKMFYSIILVVFVLIVMTFSPGITSIVLTLVLAAMLLLCRILLAKYLLYNEIQEAQKEVIVELNQKILDLRSLTKTVKYTTSIEERNRIAARIHDQVGHGISGSIIMLEASMMIMKDNPEKATKSIEKAISNLRAGVDDIRASLKEERVDHFQLDKNDIIRMLEEFQVTYNRSAKLVTSGNLDFLTTQIWGCIHDNMKECMTNVLKHSNATEFIVSIEVIKKIIKVDYKDNGTSKEGFEKGTGLESIEDRTLNCKGRCFFNKSEKGFCVTNIFTY